MNEVVVKGQSGRSKRPTRSEEAMNHQKVRNLLARSKKPVCKKQEGRLQEASRRASRRGLLIVKKRVSSVENVAIVNSEFTIGISPTFYQILLILTYY